MLSSILIDPFGAKPCDATPADFPVFNQMIVIRSRQIYLQRRGFTLVELLVVIAIIGVLVALLLPAVQSAREAARRAQCEANIKNVSLAVLNYESARKRLPVGMSFNPLLESTLSRLANYNQNWIIYILPYIEEQSTYDSFNFKRPINDPAPPANNLN